MHVRGSQMKKTVLNIDDIMLLIEYLFPSKKKKDRLKDEMISADFVSDKTFKDFEVKYGFDHKFVETMKRQLQRKKIIDCKKINGVDGKLFSEKVLLIQDREEIKLILKL